MFPFEMISLASERIRPFLPPTPLMYSAALSELTKAQVWLKLECRQPTGSFKVRGALNKVGSLQERQDQRGLVTGSAGNHGLGVAFAAKSFDRTGVDIFVPTNAPQAKVAKLRRFPVTIHQAGETYEDAHQAAETFARQTGAFYVPAYNDLEVIAGQGTLAQEVLDELPEVDMMLVPVGGGGLIAGIACATKAIAPSCRVVGVQAEASPSAWLSLRDGVAYDPYDHEPTIADGLAGGFGALPFDVAGKLIDGVVLASEKELRRAIFTLLDSEQLVVEASGACAISPLLLDAEGFSGQKVVCVLSGGNLETTLLRDILIEFTAF